MKYSPQQQQLEQKDSQQRYYYENDMSSVNATPARAAANALQRSASAASQSTSAARRALTCRPLSTDMFAWMRVFRLANMLHQKVSVRGQSFLEEPENRKQLKREHRLERERETVRLAQRCPKLETAVARRNQRIVKSTAAATHANTRMRRPLVRHLSEGGGGDGPRRQSIRPDDGDVATTWGCRDYRRHQSSSDLLKVPFGGRGRFSPEPKITSLFHGSGDDGMHAINKLTRYATSLSRSKLKSLCNDHFRGNKIFILIPIMWL
uniref:Uncharacterized protein n=1 Tax=Trichogramma kaykai TaxID=54128 RepID=A0ABD2X911_9HYME